MTKKKKVGELRGDSDGHLIDLDSRSQKIPIITLKKKKKQQTVEPGDAFEDTAFKTGFEIVNF